MHPQACRPALGRAQHSTPNHHPRPVQYRHSTSETLRNAPYSVRISQASLVRLSKIVPCSTKHNGLRLVSKKASPATHHRPFLHSGRHPLSSHRLPHFRPPIAALPLHCNSTAASLTYSRRLATVAALLCRRNILLLLIKLDRPPVPPDTLPGFSRRVRPHQILHHPGLTEP